MKIIIYYEDTMIKMICLHEVINFDGTNIVEPALNGIKSIPNEECLMNS